MPRGLRLSWRKRRCYCRELACPRTSFTESVAHVPTGARITTRLRQTAGDKVRNAGCTVVHAGRELGLSWPTVMNAARTQARSITEAEPGPVAVLSIDETRRRRPKVRIQEEF